jgi:hypothetical protein
MKLILVNQRYGHTRTIVIRGWMKGFLSLCLIGAPVALGYLGYGLAFSDAGNSSLVSQESPVAADEFIHGEHQTQRTGHSRTPAQTGRVESTDETGSDLASEHFADTRLLFVSDNNLRLIASADLPADFSLQEPPASFRHGRIVDPSSYFHHTLH